MPTDDERREAAARLRELHLGGGSKDLIELTLSDAIGAWRKNGMSWDFITERLADLIEPEERTCHINLVDVTDSLGQKMYRCSECGALMTDDACFFEGEVDIGWFLFCPNCGAKVVEE